MCVKKGAVLICLVLGGACFAWLGLPARSATLDAGGTSSGQCGQAKPLPLPSYRSFFGRQLPVEGKSREWRIHLASWSPSKWPPRRFTFSIKNNLTGATYRLTFSGWDSPPRSLHVDQVDQVTPLSGSRALVLGRAAAEFPIADLIALPSGRIVDRFGCFAPAISPGCRFLAFVKSFPLHPGPVSIDDEYLVYDLTRGPAYNRPHFKPGKVYDQGWPVYPPGATNAAGEDLVHGLSSPVHRISSNRLFWLGPATLAFTDYYNAQDKLVVVDLEHGVKEPSVRTVILDPSDVLDLERCKKAAAPSDFSRWSRDPAGLIQVNRISPGPGTRRGVCLGFATEALPHSCFVRENLMLQAP